MTGRQTVHHEAFRAGPLPHARVSLACTGLLGGDTADTAGGGGSETCVWYLDQDGDGFGDPDRKEATCERPSGYVASNKDCDDEDARANPDAKEVCDSVDADEDCNGVADEEDEAVVLDTFYADADGDGYGDPDTTEAACDAPDGFVDNADDCDDDDRRINPDGQEVCDVDGNDEDCDGLVNTDDDTMSSTGFPTWTIDSDGDGYGATGGSTKKQCDEPSGYAGNDDDCDDGDRNVNPGESEVCGNGQDDNCNSSADGCGLTGDYSLSSADLVLSGPNSGDFGYSVCGGGDIDGDGNADIVVGSPATASDGTAYAFYGGLSGSKTYTNADVTFTGESAGDAFGWACVMGDFDGDGEADVAVGDPYYSYSSSSSYLYSGRVYLFQTALSASEPASSANTIYTNSNNGGDNLGLSLAGGTWSADAAEDLIMGATENYVFMDYGNIGSSSGKDIFGINEFEGALTYNGEVASGGDIDGDGQDDLVVTDTSGKGAACLYVGSFGSAVSLSSYTEATVNGGGANDALGTSVAIDGDLDGDGYADVLLGAGGAGGGNGAVYGCFGPLTGSKTATSCDLVITAQTSGGTMGDDVAYIGDENGDGAEDILIGAPLVTGDRSSSGVAYLYRGPLSGTKRESDADATFSGTYSSGRVGFAVSRAGDFNGDGNDDLLIGGHEANTNGMAYVMFGGDM